MLTIGKIINTHGINGELKILRLTDFEDRFTVGNTIYIINNKNEKIPVEIVGFRQTNKFDILKFAEYNHIDEAEKLKGLELKIHKDQVSELDDEEYYYFEIIGCDVYTTDGEKIGIVDSIMSPGANDVWVVKNSKKQEFLIPYIPQVVKMVDIDAKRIEIELMEGLLD